MPPAKRPKRQRKPSETDPFPHITNAKKRAFLTAYSQLGVIGGAAKAAGVTRWMHKYWKARPGKEGEEYRAAFEEATQQAGDVLVQEAFRRAVAGWDEPVFYRGKKIDTVRKYDSTLLIFLIKGALPGKYRERADIRQTTDTTIHVETQTVDDWYGNATRIRAASNGASSGYPAEPSTS